MNNKEKLELADWVVKEAAKCGADQTGVSIYNNRGIQIECRDKKIERLQESTQNSLSLSIYAKHRYSSHSTNDLKKESLKKFISEAVASTKYLTEDEFRKLPDPKYYPKDTSGDLGTRLDMYDDYYTKIESSDRVKMAMEMERIAMAQSDKIISATAGYSDSYSEGVKVHSNGLSGAWTNSGFNAGVVVTVKDENGRPEDWYYVSTRFYKDIPSAESIAKNAVQRTLRKIGQKKIESGKYTMLVENRACGNLLNMLYGPMTARALQQKSSFLDGMIGKKIASDKLTVIDDPLIKKGLGSQYFDGDGLATQKRIMIEKGILRNYYIDNYYGSKLGMELTIGGPSNITFECGSRSPEEMIKDVKKGIFINGFIGGNSNSTTGDFSYGIVGLLIENGAITKPVNEMNISGNAKEFWQQLVEMGNDPYKYSSLLSPTMMFDGVNFSGI